VGVVSGCGRCKLYYSCRYSSEFLGLAVSQFDAVVMNRVLPQIEELIQLALKDADSVARKNGRR
jgi:hypothetical protein